MARLPQPGADNGSWGDILNDFLLVEHNADGTLKSSGSLSTKADDTAVIHNTGNEAVAGTKTFSSSPVVPLPTLGSQAANKTYVDSTVSAGSPDATTGSKGIVQLAGDLGGTAASPAVPGLASKENTITAGTTSQYWRGDKSWQTLDKTAVGLANVDNTSDVNKPVSTAQQTALNLKADTTVTDGLNTRVTALESAGIVTLTDGATISTDASAGKHFRVTVAGDRTLAAPTNATDGMHRIWEITASAADRSLTLTSGSSGSFEFTTNITSPITITNGKTLFLGAIYNASRSRWTVLASKATT